MITGDVSTGDIVVGVGARSGVSADELRAALSFALGEAGVHVRDIIALVTAEKKLSEPAFHEVAGLLGVPVQGFSTDLLDDQSAPNPSARVKIAVGTASVAEAAVLAAGAEITVPKQIRGDVTVAIGRKPGRRPEEYDLSHHGDAETGYGLVDLAVNVRGAAPDWLADRLRARVADLAAYPDPRAATAAVAARHGRPVEQVLLTAGAAEAFVLLARALRPRRAVVVHPQFTEPEAALRAAGHAVTRVVLPPPFTLDPALIPPDADLVIVGNPTNPTSVLHPAATLRQLIRPGRVLLVDEAFMDAVPGEPETLADSRGQAGQPELAGLVVTRSLTKTWGLAGLRIGYLVGDEAVLEKCAAHQPLWSVNTLALEAAIAASEPEAVAQANRMAEQLQEDRDYLLKCLETVDGIEVAGPAYGPFLLIKAPVGAHPRLRAAGWAVRRADTFPGLGAGWLRCAIREPRTSDGFVRELALAVHDDLGVN